MRFLYKVFRVFFLLPPMALFEILCALTVYLLLQMERKDLAKRIYNLAVKTLPSRDWYFD